MQKMVAYEDLALVPSLIAEDVCNRVYKGEVPNIEEKRKLMSAEDKQVFCDIVDKMCRVAYEQKVDWFIKIARCKTNRGREELYMWISHWLAASLFDNVQFRVWSGVCS